MASKAEMITEYLGIPLAEWQKSCKAYPELEQLTLKNIQQHVESNFVGLKLDTKEEWISLCQKAPQLYCINLETLQQHITENANVMGVSEERWKKTCKQEPGLFIYKADTLKKSLSEAPKVLGITLEDWKSACIKRGALLTYNPKTLKEKVDNFIGYVREPKKLLKKIQNPSEQVKTTLTDFQGIFLVQKEVVAGFLKHPNNFALSAEKSAFAFAYLYEAVRAYGINKSPYELVPYLDLSEKNLQLHYLNACLTRHEGDTVTLYALAGAKKKEVKDRLSKTIPAKVGTDDEVLKNFACPLLQKLKGRDK